jgi:hypothetical protein
MPTDLTAIPEHQPGELARLDEIIGETGARIRGMAAFTGEGRSVVHVLLDDLAVARCRAALQRAGMGIADQREVLVIEVEDRPGAIGELTRLLADANVNVDLDYTTFGGVKIVIATDDLASARAALLDARPRRPAACPPRTYNQTAAWLNQASRTGSPRRLAQLAGRSPRPTARVTPAPGLTRWTSGQVTANRAPAPARPPPAATRSARTPPDPSALPSADAE